VKPLQQSIQLIRSALKDETPPAALDAAAVLYAQACSEAEQRLDRVAAMLQKGSDYQALQVAEEEPPLLDLVAVLSFGEEKNWQTLCETHGLRVAPRLNARTVQDLEALYAKGISANHPLYKDFRAAVLSRDDAKSLRIVRTILKLNPTDDNAKQELLRLENKRVQEQIDQLREALKTDDEERIATLTEALKAAAPAAKLERLDAYQQGESVRAALRRRQTEARLPELLEQMTALQQTGSWQELGRTLEEVEGMVKEHGLEPLEDAPQKQLQRLAAYHQKEKAADEKRRVFDRTLKGFIRYVEEIETRLLTGSGVTFAEIAERDESFVKRWKELEGFQLPVPNETLQRLRSAGQELRAKLDRMQRAKRLRNMALAASVLLLLTGISALGLHAWKAWTLRQELAGYQEKETCGPAEELIVKLRQEEQLLLRWPYLQAKIEEVDAWTAQARKIEEQATVALTTLEQSFTGDTSAMEPAALVKKIEAARALVGQLAADFSASAKNRLNALETRRDLHLAGVLKKTSAGTEAAITAIESMSAEELSHEKLAAKVAVSCQQIEAKLRPLEQLGTPEAEALKLPADLETRISRQRSRLDLFKKEVDAFAALRAETAQATTLDAYKQVLAKWQDIPFTETAPAHQMLDTLPTEKSFQGDLLTAGDQTMLAAIEQDKSGRHMCPDKALEADQNAILSLDEDKYLNNIFDCTIHHYSGRRADSNFWSQGRPVETVIGYSTRWTAKFFEPDTAKMSVMFIDRSFTRAGNSGDYQGDGVTASKLSQTSEFMNLLALRKITDDKGERIFRPLLEVMEAVVKNANASPIAKAYVMMKLESMMLLRKYEWAHHLCPSLQKDLRDLHLLTGNMAFRSEDWLVPEMRARWSKPLGSFFTNCKDRQYLREAIARRNYLLASAKAGLRFAGYVETDLTLKLSQGALAAKEWWVVDNASGKPSIISNTQSASATNNGAKSVQAPKARPLSPVFVIPVDRSQLTTNLQKDLSADGIELKPLAGESLFLTAP